MQTAGPAQATRSDSTVVVLAVFAVCTTLFWLVGRNGPSPDLYATWLAAEFFAKGELGAVYPSDTDVFRMLPPEAWVTLEMSRGYVGELYPYIYPPLWAAGASALHGRIGFEQILPVATLINSALLSGMMILAWRAAGRPIALLLWAVIAMIGILGTFVGYVAIQQNQPQILVSFLIILAIERHRAGRSGWAGAALALAAAIKVYPALFAIFYFATRDWAALRGFAVAGAALAGLSVLVAGWPLHMLFLEQLAAISGTIFVTPITLTLWAVAGQIMDPKGFEFVTSARITEDPAAEIGGWHVMAKGPLLSAVSTVGMLALLALAAGLYRKADSALRAVCIWPLALGSLALISPLSWPYHYLPLFAFLPALLSLLGRRAGALCLLAAILPILLPVMPAYVDLGFADRPVGLVGTLSIIFITACFTAGLVGRAPGLQTQRPADA
ncbi:MAG: glycosyltransferase family 87 protein [Pseudomonadota bacterium]